MPRKSEHLRKDWASRAAAALASSLGRNGYDWDSLTAQFNVARLLRRAWKNGRNRGRQTTPRLTLEGYPVGHAHLAMLDLPRATWDPSFVTGHWKVPCRRPECDGAVHRMRVESCG